MHQRQIGNRGLIHHLHKIHLPRQVLAQPVAVLPEYPFYFGPAQVAVEDQHFFPGLRKAERSIANRRRFPFLRLGRGHHDNLRRILRIRKQQRRAQPPVGFRNQRTPQCKRGQLNLLLGQRLHLRFPPPGAMQISVSAPARLQTGNQSQRRQPDHILHVVRRLHRVVQVGQEKRQTHASHQPQHQSERQVLPHVRACRRRRHFRLIDDANVARLEARRHARFLHALQQPVVQLLVGLHLSFDDVVLDARFAQLVGQRFLLFESRGQQPLARQRRLVFLAGVLDRQPPLAFQLRPRLPHPALQLLHLRH